MNTLRESLIEANKQYRLGTPIMTDEEYDAALEQLGPNDPLLQDTGSEEAIDPSRKVKLPIPMHSYEKVYFSKERGDQITPFLTAANATPLFASLKYDGAALLLEYEKGKLKMAYTKGRKELGQKALEHAQLIPGIPITTTKKEHFFVKVELVISKKLFEKEYSETYNNPRNFVAGLLNSKTPEADKLKHITAIAHTLSDQPSKKTAAERLKKLGFTVAKYKTNVTFTAEYLDNWLKTAKEQEDYLVDGIVIEWNCPETEFHSNGNPKHAVAYKTQLSQDRRETTITSIDWETSKEGNLYPTVNFIPVEIGGTTVSRASAYNYDNVINLGLSEGTKILIEKSGDIIPTIVEVITKNKKSKIPKNCKCGALTQIESPHLQCERGKSCPLAISQQTLAFLRIIGVENIGEEIVALLTPKCYQDYLNITDPTSLVTTGFGIKSATKLYLSLQDKLKGIPIEKIAHATGIFSPSLGSRKLKNIFEASTPWETITEQEIINLPGFSDKTAKVFINNRQEFQNFLATNSQITPAKAKAQNTTKPEASYVFTGFRDKDLEEQAAKYNIRIASSISAKVSGVVAKDPTANSSKLDKAKQLNIPILSIQEFKTQVLK